MLATGTDMGDTRRCGLAGAYVGQSFTLFGLFAHHTRDEFCGGGVGVWLLEGHEKRANLGRGVTREDRGPWGWTVDVLEG